MYQKKILTPIGVMIAMATDEALYVLDFFDQTSWKLDQEKVLLHLGAANTFQENTLLLTLEQELKEYFAGQRKEFSLPVAFVGTSFQEEVWNYLLTIPYGQTHSYKQQAEGVGNPKGVRAVANANSRNRLSIVVPCHRVIGSNGALTGYTGGIARKEFLLNLERKNLL